ncbi:MAG: serpin family protein [Saprospiraceae bacterium]
MEKWFSFTQRQGVFDLSDTQKELNMRPLRSFLFFFPFLLWQCHNDKAVITTVDFSCGDYPDVCLLTEANTDFAIRLYKKVHALADESENVFVSPFSISTALAMTMNGAAHETLDEFETTLGLQGMTSTQRNASFQTLQNVLPYLDATTRLNFANSIWPQVGFPVIPSFLDTNAIYFSSEVNAVDFRGNLSGSLASVNDWIAENTDGLVQNALTSLPPDVVMLLVNTIYFKGKWKAKFDARDTQNAPFYTPNGELTAEMMHIEEGTFPYYNREVFQMIDLPYGDSIYSMTVLLPNEGYQVSDIVEILTPDSYVQWLSEMQPHNTELFFPKFKVSYKTSMKPALFAMGLQDAFTRRADFTRLVSEEDVFIGDVIHQAAVEVNESGTEAAAVTVVILEDNSIGSSFSPVFRADKPFLYIIRDNKTNSILFIGQLMEV